MAIMAARGYAPAPDPAPDNGEANMLLVLEKGLSIPYTVPGFVHWFPKENSLPRDPGPGCTETEAR